MTNIAVISPGLLPIPPVIGGSVETVIQKTAEVTSGRFFVDVYGPAHRRLSSEEREGNLTYYRFSTQNYSDYFKFVRNKITELNKYSIIQVENRPLFIPKTKALNPKSKFICSLHSLDHINERLIRKSSVARIFELCDSILVYSGFVKGQLMEMFPESAGKVRTVHLAAEAEKFRPKWDPIARRRAQELKEKLGIEQDSKVLLFVGRVIPKKGVDVLIKAMEDILTHYPDTCLVIIGSNWFGNKVPTDYYREMKKQAAKFGNRIIFTNYVHPDYLPQYYSMADIFVCPSQWDEPFGLVNVEAMASGIPVVASARGGIPEIIDDGINGFLVEKESQFWSFVKPIVELLKDPNKADSFGRAGRNKVEQYFNWNRVGQEMVALYEEII